MNSPRHSAALTDLRSDQRTLIEDAEDRVKAVVAGFQHHLSKPVEPVELIVMVASLVGR